MSIPGFPTSSDIYLEADGVRVAVVQSYAAKTTKSSTAVEAFGEIFPESASSILAAILSSVDFPMPLIPITPIFSRSLILNPTSSRSFRSV